MDEGGAVAVPELYERIASGALRVTIGRRFAFDDVIEALRALDGGHVRGKIVVQM